MKIFIQKYYNIKGEIRFQIVGENAFDDKKTEVIIDDILTYEAAEKSAIFYAKQMWKEE